MSLPDYVIFFHHSSFSPSLILDSHATPEIPVILTSFALETCLIHHDALVLVGVVINSPLLRMAPYGQPKGTLCTAVNTTWG